MAISETNLPTKWLQQIWPENWGLCPFGEGSWVPIQHNVASAEAKFHLEPSNRLATIHQRHRQNRQDRTERQWSDSIGQTILQTAAKNKPHLVAL